LENNFPTALTGQSTTTLTGQSTHEDQVKNPACGAFHLISLACGAFFFIKNLAFGAFFSLKIFFLIIWGYISLQVSYSVSKFISSEND